MYTKGQSARGSEKSQVDGSVDTFLERLERGEGLNRGGEGVECVGKQGEETPGPVARVGPASWRWGEEQGSRARAASGEGSVERGA